MNATPTDTEVSILSISPLMNSQTRAGQYINIILCYETKYRLNFRYHSTLIRPKCCHFLVLRIVSPSSDVIFCLPHKIIAVSIGKKQWLWITAGHLAHFLENTEIYIVYTHSAWKRRDMIFGPYCPALFQSTQNRINAQYTALIRKNPSTHMCHHGFQIIKKNA